MFDNIDPHPPTQRTPHHLPHPQHLPHPHPQNLTHPHPPPPPVYLHMLIMDQLKICHF